MATFTATAGSSSTIGYAQYGSSSWHVGTDQGACQGAYQATSSSGSRVGVMVFSGAGTALNNTIITKITLKFVSSSAGSSSSSKVMTIRKAKYQTLNKSVKGSAQVGDVLGKLTGKFYGNTVTHTLDATNNTALFNALVAYLQTGNSALVIYNGETSSSSSYSSNYMRIASCVMTVTYEMGTAWYCNGSAWQKCLVYYYNGSAWVQCIPYYCDGSTWKQV